MKISTILEKIEKFFVRNGNASQEIPLSEMNPYMKERFSR